MIDDIKQTKVYEENGKINIESPYNDRFIYIAHRYQGTFVRPSMEEKRNGKNVYWSFDKKYEDKLNVQLSLIYNEPFKKFGGVTIKVDLDSIKYHTLDNIELEQYFYIGKTLIAVRYERDEDVDVVNPETHFKKGGWIGSGGSRNNPEITFTDGSILITKVSPSDYELVKDYDGIELIDNSDKIRVIKDKISKKEKEIASLKGELKKLEN